MLFAKPAQSPFQLGQGNHVVVFPHGPTLKEGDLFIKLALLAVSHEATRDFTGETITSFKPTSQTTTRKLASTQHPVSHFS
jgi:hypothetical protein